MFVTAACRSRAVTARSPRPGASIDSNGPRSSYAAQRAFDDPLVFAEYRLTGEAFAGTVTATEPDRVVGEGRSRKLRPLITVTTLDPVRLAPGTELVAVTRPGQTATVVEVERPARCCSSCPVAWAAALAPEPGTMPGARRGRSATRA